MKLIIASQNDYKSVESINKHITKQVFTNLVLTKSCYLIYDNEEPIGVITWCLFWDKIPFMNLIYIKEEKHNQGIGKQALLSFEQCMKELGHQMIMTSTQMDETAQFFYRKLGYLDCGGLILQDTPHDQPMEMFLRKVI